MDIVTWLKFLTVIDFSSKNWIYGQFSPQIMAQIYKPFQSQITTHQIQELQKHFDQIDKDKTGYVNYVEATQIFSHKFQVSVSTAKLLFRVFNKTQLQFEELQQVFGFLLCCHTAFINHGKDELDLQEVAVALQELFFNFNDPIIKKLVQKFSTTNSVSQTQFFELATVCNLSRKIFAEWDAQEKGSIEVGLEQIIELATLFM